MKRASSDFPVPRIAKARMFTFSLPIAPAAAASSPGRFGRATMSSKARTGSPASPSGGAAGGSRLARFEVVHRPEHLELSAVDEVAEGLARLAAQRFARGGGHLLDLQARGGPREPRVNEGLECEGVERVSDRLAAHMRKPRGAKRGFEVLALSKGLCGARPGRKGLAKAAKAGAGRGDLVAPQDVVEDAQGRDLVEVPLGPQEAAPGLQDTPHLRKDVAGAQEGHAAARNRRIEPLVGEVEGGGVHLEHADGGAGRREGGSRARGHRGRAVDADGAALEADLRGGNRERGAGPGADV